MMWKKLILNPWLQLLAFFIFSLILYSHTIGRSFVSDDYLVLRRVVLDGILLMKGFFRPLSDFTIYINYLIGGFNPIGYNLFNILLHGLNSFLIFKFCQRWKWTNNDFLQNRYAVFASILFLCYPFHNESIVWLLGRASSMATTFGILALLCLVSSLSENLKIFLSCLCVFIGLASYEYIMVLPIMGLVILYEPGTKWQRYKTWLLGMIATFIVHLLIRYEISGTIVGSYGKGFFTTEWLHYFSNIFKVTTRLFLPPIENSVVFFILFVLLAIFLFIITRYTWRRTSNKQYFIKILVLVSLASLFPVLFSVSTKTSESDRFLHFPSFFICCLIAFVLLNLISNHQRSLTALVLICIYFVIFLERNNANWIKASAISENIVYTVGKNKNHQKILIINLPDEYNGAYIFRLGFKDALIIHGIDTTNIQVVNHLKREQMLALSFTIRPITHEKETEIAPEVTLVEKGMQFVVQRKNAVPIYLKPGEEYQFMYWNNQEMIVLQ